MEFTLDDLLRRLGERDIEVHLLRKALAVAEQQIAQLKAAANQ